MTISIRRSVPSRIFLLVLSACLLSSTVHADGPLRKKLGQMMLIGYLGPVASDTLLADLTSRNLGGVILSYANHNLDSLHQIQRLTNQIRLAAQTAPFIAADQEGGLVARLGPSNGFAATYSEYKLGTTFASVDSTRKQAQLMAGWMKNCGMSVDFAPVIDVNVNPNSPAIGALGRSYSADPHVVSLHAQAFADAFHARQLMVTSKHFPGHGSAATDSHNSLPDITDTWKRYELDPYEDLLATNSLDLVMVGHLYNANIDPVYPTSLSFATVNGLLRDTLGFQGVVITDALGMGALSGYSMWDAAELAINAGDDILLYTTNLLPDGTSLVRQMIDTLEARVTRGSIASSRIDDAYAHIMALKTKYLITSVSSPIAAGSLPRTSELSNYPNPFNPSTTIRFSLPERSTVRVEVCDLLGRIVDRLFAGELPAGIRELHWQPMGAGGIYFCRMESAPVAGPGRVVQVVRKMVYVK